jgi:hypothetical protein
MKSAKTKSFNNTTHTFNKILHFVCQTGKCVEGVAQKAVALGHYGMVFTLQRTMRLYTMVIAAVLCGEVTEIEPQDKNRYLITTPPQAC